MNGIKNVTVIGANGTMGRNVAAIFASFGHANVYMVCRSFEKAEKAKEKAYQSVRAESIKNKMIPADYSMLEKCILESDFVFESCAENWGVKSEVHQQIATILKNSSSSSKKIICTGTSGLSVTSIAEFYDEEFRKNVFGMHFFNPPYQLTLCELISTKYTDKEVFEEVCNYANKELLRTVVETKDAPAFLGNRIGFQFINEAMQLAEKYADNGGIDYIDTILGPFTGRAMAPLVTANFVGLDVHKAIMENLYENTDDFAKNTFRMPQYLLDIINQGNLGRKTGAGLYQTKVNRDGTKMHLVYDVKNGIYREKMNYMFPFIEKMVKCFQRGDYKEGFLTLEKNHSLEAEICMESLLKYVLYSLNTVKLVGYNVHSADDVMAAGFNWCPPLAIVDAFGGKEPFKKICIERISKDWLDVELQEELLDEIEESKYDYRRFIRAKR